MVDKIDQYIYAYYTCNIEYMNMIY